MSGKINLVRVLTAATGNSTPITLGAAFSSLFMTPAEAGAVNGRTYTYLIVDGNDWEMGRGAYTSSGTTLARTTVLASRISGTLGTSRITLSGTAQVRFIESADDSDGVRGTRAVTGTSDTIANTDHGYAITYSNASAIAASLAQAGTSLQFLDGWRTWIKNTGAGTLTITPATSTINGASTLVLATNLGAMIWSDGTNYHAYVFPLTKPLLAANNLADVGSAATARANLGSTTVGDAVFVAANASAARTAIGAAASITSVTASLGVDVNLNNVSNFFDGPSVAQGTSGTWFASATITVTDSAIARIFVKLWDGTTVIASSEERIESGGTIRSISLSGVISSPAGNIRISCKDVTTTGGKILANDTGLGSDSTITAVRIA